MPGKYSQSEYMKARYVQDRTLNAIKIPYDKHHKVSSLVKSHQNTQFCQI